MVDWDRFARNMLYGAVHRPAQIVRWIGRTFLVGEAAPLGADVVRLASEIDSEAFSSLHPVYPPTKPSPSVSGPFRPPPSGPPTYVKPTWGTAPDGIPTFGCPPGYLLTGLQGFPEIGLGSYTCEIIGGPAIPEPPPEAVGWA